MTKSLSVLRGAALALALGVGGFVTAAYAAPGQNDAFGSQQDAVIRHAAVGGWTGQAPAATAAAALRAQFRIGENDHFGSAVAPQMSGMTLGAPQAVARLPALYAQFRVGENTAFSGGRLN
jgi:hypothetical protein